MDHRCTHTLEYPSWQLTTNASYVLMRTPAMINLLPRLVEAIQLVVGNLNIEFKDPCVLSDNGEVGYIPAVL